MITYKEEIFTTLDDNRYSLTRDSKGNISFTIETVDDYGQLIEIETWNGREATFNVIFKSYLVEDIDMTLLDRDPPEDKLSTLIPKDHKTEILNMYMESFLRLWFIE